jgi:hypothetical protein
VSTIGSKVVVGEALADSACERRDYDGTIRPDQRALPADAIGSGLLD